MVVQIISTSRAKEWGRFNKDDFRVIYSMVVLCATHPHKNESSSHFTHESLIHLQAWLQGLFIQDFSTGIPRYSVKVSTKVAEWPKLRLQNKS
jgi:hypothetical protein